MMGPELEESSPRTQDCSCIYPMPFESNSLQLVQVALQRPQVESCQCLLEPAVMPLSDSQANPS